MKKESKGKASPATPSTRRRQRCSEKERRRNVDINQAFFRLQTQLPVGNANDVKLPRIKTLRLAMRYIEHLAAILRGDQMVDYNNCRRPLTLADFNTVALAEMQVRNSYSARMFEEDMEGGRYSLPPSGMQETFYNTQMPVNFLQFQSYALPPTEQLQDFKSNDRS